MLPSRPARPRAGPALRAAGGRPPVRGRRLGRPLGLAAGLLALAGSAAAWPAIQDPTGAVAPCESRPAALPDGRWTCRAGGVEWSGALIEIVRPGAPAGVPPWGDRPGPPRNVLRPWGPWSRPPGEPSGYDALDPWLGRRGGAER